MNKVDEVGGVKGMEVMIKAIMNEGPPQTLLLQEVKTAFMVLIGTGEDEKFVVVKGDTAEVLKLTAEAAMMIMAKREREEREESHAEDQGLHETN
jgi:hypothetical protein